MSRLVDKLRETRAPQDHNEYAPRVELIKKRAEELFREPEGRFTEITRGAGKLLKASGASEEAVSEVLSMTACAFRRGLGMKLYDGQIAAGLALHHGHMVQMNTGEGKTLSAVLPACLNALSGERCHVLTFNDYLARRDAEWMSPVYSIMGVATGIIQKQMPADQRKMAYASDVTYATAREVGFDYLRDSLLYNSEDIVQKPFMNAIVDEADSIMIDGARIPLVIAGELPPSRIDPYRTAALVGSLKEDLHWELDEHERNAYFTDEGFSLIEESLECGDLHDGENRILLAELNNALHAGTLLRRNIDYLVRNQRIELIDQFTGRTAPDRRWPDGLQSALEAKEGVPILPGGRILGSIPLQYFLELYPNLSGLTATAEPAHQEFLEFYNLDLVRIPPEKKSIRVDHEDRLFTHVEAKNAAIVEELKLFRETPVLVGTGSVEESERLSALLADNGISCCVLNARDDSLEASIVAEAGAPGAVTISTNMAGRGTDIKLGGSHEEQRSKAVSLGGLHVIGTNRHESRRIDQQLRGRAGRQGDPGSSRFFVSLEDDLMTRFGIKRLVPEGIWPEKTMEPIENKTIHREVTRLQSIVEEQNFEIRKTLREYSMIIELQRRRLHRIRQDILQGREDGSSILKQASLQRQRLLQLSSEPVIEDLERRILLHSLDECWSDHLAYASHLQDGIHLVAVGGLNPLQEFQKTVFTAFDRLLEEVAEISLKIYMSVRSEEDIERLSGTVLKGPSSTWTYLVNDRVLNDLDQIFLAGSNSPFTAAAVMTTWPLLLAGLVRRWFRAGPKSRT